MSSSWRDVSEDPNSAEALSLRSAQLRKAWRPPVNNRFEVIGPLVANRKVLDVGCVDHRLEALQDDSLHGLIRRRAAQLISADIDRRGIEQLIAAGEQAVETDLDSPESIEALRDLGPYEVIVAGELIEHLTRTIALFELARATLSEDGRLVMTTPNPFALHRARAGWRRDNWENADHIAWLFPSAVAELADRSGLMVESAQTCGANADARLGALLRTWRRGLRRRVSLSVRGRSRPSAHLKNLELPLPAILGSVLVGARGSHWLGETAIYVLRRA